MCVTQWAVWVLGCGLSNGSVFKVRVSKSQSQFCLGSDPCICSPVVSPAVHKQFYKIAFLGSFFAVISPILSGLFSLQPECWSLFTHYDTHLVQLSPCLGASNEKKVLKNINKCSVHLLGPQLFWLEFFLPQSFGAPIAATIPAATKELLRGWDAREWRNGGKYGEFPTFY